MVLGKHDIDRRSLLGALAASGVAGGVAGGVGVAASAQAAERSAPKAVHVYDAVALLEETVPHGTTPIGQRFRVPIIGGTCEGPDIRGRILPGGFD